MDNTNKDICQYKSDEIIYPDDFARKFGCTSQESYRILNEAENEGTLKSLYIYFCPHCTKDVGTANVFNELPDYVVCGNCGTMFSALRYCRLAFVRV